MPIIHKSLSAVTSQKIRSKFMITASAKTISFLVFLRTLVGRQIFIFLFMAVFAGPTWADSEGTSRVFRSRDKGMESRSYERYEKRPRAQLPFLEGPIPRKALITLSSTAERVRIRKYMSDAHVGLKFYQRRTCEDCHPDQTRDLHRIRADITCSQCHGTDPIAGIRHYYSPMNPRRRYAFICAKCHEGASKSFASYVIHSPNPARIDTLKSFPILFLVFWAMIVLALGTFLVFLPHTLIWGMREIFMKKGNDRE